MDTTTVTLSIPYLLRDRLLALLGDDFGFDQEDEAEAQGVKMATFDFFDVAPELDIEQTLMDHGIPHTVRVHPGYGIEGSTEHFRVHADGTPVSTAYTDSMNARMVTLDELFEARAKGVGAIDQLLNEKDNEHPVLNWNAQLEIL